MTDLFSFYPPPPAQQHSATSIAAAEAIAPKAGTLRFKVLMAIREAGADGLTDEQLQEVLDMNPSTVRPRRGELVKAGWIIDSKRTRKTRSGVLAVVWVETK